MDASTKLLWIFQQTIVDVFGHIGIVGVTFVTLYIQRKLVGSAHAQIRLLHWEENPVLQTKPNRYNTLHV